jgi:hypothetical protein
VSFRSFDLEGHLNELVVAKAVSYEEPIMRANAPDLIRRPGAGAEVPAGFRG